MKEYVIGKNDSGQRLDKYLTKTFPNLPKSLMYKYIRIKRIKVNGKRAEISTRLNEGDTVSLYVNDELIAEKPAQYDFMGASTSLDIVYEDGNIMLLNKKSGLLSHPADREYVDTLIGRVKRYLYEKGEYDPRSEASFTPSLVNRIDRNTSGIVIAAKNAESLRIMNEKIKNRQVHKYYLCVVHGAMERESGILEGYLVKDEKKNLVKIYRDSASGGKEIRTKYKVLDKKEDLSLLEIELLTGRTHQIRAHFASIGHPLLGDGKYGRNDLNKKTGLKKQCLCSYKLVFDFSEDAGILEYLNHREYEIKKVWFRDEFKNL